MRNPASRALAWPTTSHLCTTFAAFDPLLFVEQLDALDDLIDDEFDGVSLLKCNLLSFTMSDVVDYLMWPLLCSFYALCT